MSIKLTTTRSIDLGVQRRISEVMEVAGISIPTATNIFLKRLVARAACH